jgi:hypothetical protein
MARVVPTRNGAHGEMPGVARSTHLKDQGGVGEKRERSAYKSLICLKHTQILP